MGLLNKSFFQRACYRFLGSVPICPKILISGDRLGQVPGIKALPSQCPGYQGGCLPNLMAYMKQPQLASKWPPSIKILTKTPHLHPIEPSSL